VNINKNGFQSRPITRYLMLRLIPIDSLLRIIQLLQYFFARLLFLRDWEFEVMGRPQFFKHAVDLASWPFEQSRWGFTARGVYARQIMHRGCKVLDICCGDGFYSSMFFSDVANKVDAVDFDAYAIDYARAYYRRANVEYYQLDITRQLFPSTNYDVVVWNAAICYFSKIDIRTIIYKIINATTPSGVLIGMCPCANGWVDHITEFTGAFELEQFLSQFYDEVLVREIDEGRAISLYFQASRPLKNLGEENERFFESN